VAGKIIADIIEAPYDSIRMNVANVTVLTANSSGLTYVPTGNVNINIGGTSANLTMNLLTANGIKFPATQVSSADANTLDDYEEGTWTPVVSDAATGGNLATLSDAEAVYTKIGNIVYWRFNVVLSNKASMAAGETLFIQGFPFQSAAIPNSWYNPNPTIIRNITFTGFVQFNQVGGTIRGYLRENVSNANGSDITVSDLTNSAAIQASGFYRVS
jgi:hypothetical protein